MHRMLRNSSSAFSLASPRFLAVLFVVVAACASSTPLTEWGYSDWFRRGAPGEMGAFEQQRDACLKQAAIPDPATVVRNSPAENHFIACMNAADWCTAVYHCEKPGA